MNITDIDPETMSRMPSIAATVSGVVGLLAVIILFRKRKAIKIAAKTLPRDFRGVTRFIRTFSNLKKSEKNNMTVGKVFEETAKKYQNKVCFFFEGDKWTFQDVQNLSNQIGNYFLHQGFKKGDNVALFMENCPEYVCIWLGLSMIGVVVPLINSNLRQKTLQHSISLAKPKAIIFSCDLAESIYTVHDSDLDLTDVKMYGWGDLKINTSPFLQTENLQFLTKDENKEVPIPIDAVNFTDNLFYIYTSGTTGLPKPAIVKHSRFCMGSISFHHMNCLEQTDVIYTCLPLYHTAAGICAVGQAIFYGNSVVIRKKFSATAFWDDCIEYGVTVAQYIGELCRYLLAQPAKVEDTMHQIRLMVGNGLRTEIWPAFIERFNIPNISEIYGSTDGNCNFVNFDNRIGAVGFIPRLLQRIYPMKLIKVDELTGELVRDIRTGMAVDCKPGEPGELVGKIIENHIIRDFSGYANMKDGSTEKKIIQDVFTKGDKAFRTGDYLVMDELGYFYFRDRTGDTFRWKGENCSTAEVESVIANICDLNDVVVYGVQVPSADGKAGMATIADPDKKLDLQYLSIELCRSLPSYAIPLFLRIAECIEATATFKLKKTQLQKENFDITTIDDPIYIYLNKAYVCLDQTIMNLLLDGKLKL